MIEARDLTKIYAGKAAVDHLTFTVAPGQVTGFLGPNGAGKSTTMRLILGLDSPTGGSGAVDDLTYRPHAYPTHEVGALLDAQALPPSRSAFNHLWSLAQSNRISRRRVNDVLDLVGLTD